MTQKSTRSVPLLDTAGLVNGLSMAAKFNKQALSVPTMLSLLQVGTAWRPDKLKEMTYTQFWQLVQQRQIDKVCSRSPHRPPCMQLPAFNIHAGFAF